MFYPGAGTLTGFVGGVGAFSHYAFEPELAHSMQDVPR
jgi:hypothetical protein